MSTHTQCIGIVIPVYGHSRLVAEAITSALQQDFEGSIHVVVVIDGDRDEETLRTVQAFLSTPDRSVASIYRKNGRLPAARNTGIKYLLSQFGDLFAIYMLDADNRLSRHSIKAFAKALIEDQNAAWAYPDVTFFGLTWGYSGPDIRETAPVYSLMRHRLGNICEAGSIIRASVFREGVLYDEAFTHGYEDWEFWLQCIERGFYGVRVKNAGFLYRRRADSMLSDANRTGSNITAGIVSKHVKIFNEDALWSVYVREMKPLLYGSAKSGLVRLSTSDNISRLSPEEFSSLLENLHQSFQHVYFPRLFIYPLTDDDTVPEIDLSILKILLKTSFDNQSCFLDGSGKLNSDVTAESRYGIFPMRRILFDDCPADVMASTLYTLVKSGNERAQATPKLVHVERRYSGPPSFHVDQFLLEHTRTMPVSKRRGLVVTAEQGRHGAIFGPLESVWSFRYISYGFFRNDSTRYQNLTIYNGARLSYRQYEPLYEIMGAATATFDRTYIVDDVSALFHVGEWKHFAKEVVFVATVALTADQNVTLQGLEHSLTRIVCRESELPKLRAAGIPARKLERIEDHFVDEILLEAARS